MFGVAGLIESFDDMALKLPQSSAVYHYAFGLPGEWCIIRKAMAWKINRFIVCIKAIEQQLERL